VALPAQSGKHRLLHVHRNVPGVLSEINRVFSDNQINVSAQYLQTNEAIGYVVIDIDAAHSTWHGQLPMCRAPHRVLF
jgi:D-3-phosphoglycerate dehydrogenase